MRPIYEFEGKVKAVLEKQTFPSGFVKQDVVLVAESEQRQYPTIIPISFKRDNVLKLDGVAVGDEVKVRFAIDGREHNGRFFVDITGLQLDVIKKANACATPTYTANKDGMLQAFAEQFPGVTDDKKRLEMIHGFCREANGDTKTSDYTEAHWVGAIGKIVAAAKAKADATAPDDDLPF